MYPRIDMAMLVLAGCWLVHALVVSLSMEVIASDDAFISFQYARNFATGHGLVFNVGERVWGFTSPLQTLILGSLTALGADTVRTAYVTGFLWVAVTSVLLYRVFSEILPRLLSLVIATFFLFDLTQHGNYTLESNLLVALQLATLLAAAKNLPRTACLLAAASCLARPDSALLVLPILLVSRECRKLKHLAWFFAVGCLWEGFAYFYFDSLLPQSFYAKVGLSRFVPFLLNALREVASGGFAAAVGVSAGSGWLARILVLLLGFLPLLNREVRARPLLWYSLVLYPWILVLAYSRIGSFTGHNWEFYSAKFFIGVSTVVGILSFLHTAAGRLRRARSMRLALSAAALLFVGAGFALDSDQLHKDLDAIKSTPYGGGRYYTFRRLAKWMASNTPPTAAFANGEVGTLAYFSKRKIIDDSGIVTRGYLPSERMNPLAFLRRFQPEYAIVHRNAERLSVLPGIQYERIAFFPNQGYGEFSILKRR